MNTASAGGAGSARAGANGSAMPSAGSLFDAYPSLPLFTPLGAPPSLTVPLPPVQHDHPLAPSLLLEPYTAPTSAIPSPRGRRASVASLAAASTAKGAHGHGHGHGAHGAPPTDLHAAATAIAAAASVANARANALCDAAALRIVAPFIEVEGKGAMPNPFLPTSAEQAAIREWHTAHAASIAEKALALAAGAGSGSTTSLGGDRRGSTSSMMGGSVTGLGSGRATLLTARRQAALEAARVRAEHLLLEERTAGLREYLAEALVPSISGSLSEMCSAGGIAAGSLSAGVPHPLRQLAEELLLSGGEGTDDELEGSEAGSGMGDDRREHEGE